MAGFVFSAAALLSALIPGLVLQYRYYHSASKWDASGNIELGSARAILVAILISLPFHAAWIIGVDLLSRRYSWGTIDFATLLPLLTGQELDSFESLNRQLNQSLLFKLSGYLLTQTTVAFLLGKWIANACQRFGHSRKVALASSGSVWHKRLRYTDEKPDIITVAVTLTLGSRTYLYYGLLESYELTEKGDLRYLTLTGARRREIGGTPTDPETYELPGEYFIIFCANVETVDIDYYWEDPDATNEPAAAPDSRPSPGTADRP